MSWPPSRFNAIYKALIQRQAVESIEFQRVQMISALFANTNWDDEKNDRVSRITELNENFDNAIELIYYPEGRKEDEIDWDNPFYAAAKRGLQKTRERYGLDGDKSMEEVVEHEEQDPKQLEARANSRRQIDQA